MVNIKTRNVNKKEKTDQKVQQSVNNPKTNTTMHKNIKLNYYMIPILFIICIIPLISKMKVYDPKLAQFTWFPSNNEKVDIFLYYKQWIFVLVAVIMLLAIAFRLYNSRKEIKLVPAYVPLIIFAVFTVLSAVFSEYSFFSFKGSFEMFESVFAILGYCIASYYAYLFLDKESDFRFTFRFIFIIAVVMSIIGVLQFLGHDILKTELAYKLMVPMEYRTSQLQFVFENNRVYLTLYNPNYVGIFTALITPIVFILLLFQKKLVPIILLGVVTIGLIICAFGSQSLSGFLGLFISIICIIIFMWRYLIKRYMVTVPILVLLALGVFFINNYTDNFLINRLKNSFKPTITESALNDIHTEEDGVSVTYNNNEIIFRVSQDNDLTKHIVVIDKNNQPIATSYHAPTQEYTIVDPRFLNIAYGFDDTYTGTFYISIEGKQWLFTNETEDNTYYYINKFGKQDEMKTAESAIFTGYENFASGRGYIWSRTIPLLKDYLLLGSGPDTFTMAYPQQDYFNLDKYGFGTQLLTKPHNMYLQMAVQTGVISLLAFLIFYGIYFANSINLYIRGRFSTFYAQFGVAIFIGTIAYMVVGFTNDSNICTAPIFWVLMGVGIALNRKVMQEIQSNKM